jgi:hypothetical protein
MEASEYQTAEELRDGSTIVIRAIHPDDRERFRHAFQQFIKSPDSVRFRFHGFKRSLSESEAIHMTKLDFVDYVSLVATFGTDREQPLIGLDRYIVCVMWREARSRRSRFCRNRKIPPHSERAFKAGADRMRC